MKIENLKPERVFYYFQELSKIPRGSKKEKKVSDWIVSFAKDNNLEYIQDEQNNVLIRKNGTSGYEHYSPLILQGHMDMVCEKNKDTKFDFEKDPIQLVYDDNTGFLKANGTTLGADNGIAVALTMALLESDSIKHPPLEVIITTDEEEGMSGAIGLDYSLFKGKTMINLDTEEYGEVYISSAGGGSTTTTFEFDKYEVKEDEGYSWVSLDLTGLSGGHSGAEIHLNIVNAIKFLSDLLWHANKKYEIVLVDVDGGEKRNAIPRETSYIIGVKLENEETLDNFVEYVKLAMENVIKDNNYVNQNPNVKITDLFYSSVQGKTRTSSVDAKRLLDLLHDYPNGVIDMSKTIDGLVETSINVGVIKTKDTEDKKVISIKAAPRSSVKDSFNKVIDRLRDISNKYGAHLNLDSTYPSWERKENSAIRDIVIESYKQLENADPIVKGIHAGLECGIFSDNIKDIDIVSIGPNIYGAHTPDERMEVNSVEKTWNLLLKILENYNIG